MRTILFMFIVSLVGSEKLKYEPTFTESLTHVYKYEGVIVTGLPEGGLSRAGVKISCGLSIIPQGHAIYLLKITDVQMLEYNGVWPNDPFISARKLTQRLAPELSKPVRFEYLNGRVGKVQAPANLPEDILNIHRGILNIFQITIKKSQNVYELQEAGIEGVCLTSYIVQGNKKANRMTITKAKDLNNCQEKVMLFTGAAYASKCPAFKQRGRNIRASATFTHVLKPTAAGAILQEAKVREVHQFTPFHELDGTAIIEARQSLVLVDVKSAVYITRNDEFTERGTLKYHYDQGVLNKPLQLKHPQNVEKAILETMKTLEAHSLEMLGPDTPAKFLQLVQLLRSAPQNITASVWGKASGSRARCWLLSALPAAGTTDALRFITTRIQRLEVTVQEAARTLALALHQVMADRHTLPLVTVRLLLFSHGQSQQDVRVSHPDVFSYKLMTGVSAKVVLMNNEGSLIPTMAAAKVSGHMLGGFADLMEVGVRMEGLQEVITKSRETISGVPDLKQIQRILNKFPDLKPAPQTVPLASAYLKLFNQEIGYVDLRRDYIHKALQALSGLDGRRGMLRRVLERLRKPVELRPAAALLAMELRRFVPTCVGMSTELTMVSAAVAKADLNVEAKIPASISSLSQLLSADVELKTQIKPSVAVYSKVVLGINTPFLQSGLELTAKLHSALPLDVSVKINVKEGSLRVNSVPVQHERQMVTLKSEVFAVSRSIENLVPVKVLPILPEIKEANIAHQKFKPSQEAQSEADVYSALGIEEAECWDNAQRPAPKPSHLNSCLSMPTFGLEMCVDTKVANALYLRHSPLYRLLGTHAARLLVKPVGAQAAITKLTLQVQTGSKAASQMMRPLEKEEPLLQRTPGRTVFMKTPHSQSRLQNGSVIGSSSSSSQSQPGSSWSWSSSSSSGRTLGGHGSGRKAGGQRHWASAGSSGHRSHHSNIHDSVSGSRRTTRDFFEMKFNSVHTSEVASKRQSAGRLSSETRQQHSSSQSSEELLLEELGAPTLTIIAKATRSDGRLQGYQLSGAMGSARASARARVQLRIVELAEGSRWKMCVDAASPSPHKAMVMFRWGENCRRYRLGSQASLGYLAHFPAIKIKTTWDSIPEGCVTGGAVVGASAAYLLGFSNQFKTNPSRQITQLIALTSPWTIDTVVKLPRVTLYYQGFELPLPLRVPAMETMVRSQGFESIAEIPQLLLTMNQRECVAKNDQVVTFDSNELSYKIPNDCFYVLAKDCSTSPTFVLLMRRAQDQTDKKGIKLLLSAPNTVIEAFPTRDGVKVSVDSVETPLGEQPQVVKGIVTIHRNRTAITLHAPSINIERLYFNGDQVQIVLDQMMGKTCGICGLNNDEKKMVMPSREVARDQEHLFESWLCPGSSCKDDCKVRRDFVELGTVVEFEGQASRCYSVEPVQRCLAGCTPMETRSRLLSFHCLSANQTVTASTISTFRWKPRHMSYPTLTHTDCWCQCSTA
ncbi:vitellogenin-like [Rhinoraja longicauda]